MAREQGRPTSAAADTAPAAATAVPAGTGLGRQEGGHELRAASASAEAFRIECHNLEFGLREQIAYHAIREQALARLSRFLTGVQVFLGTGAIASMTEVIPLAAVWLMVASSLAGVVLLVVDPSGGARDHRALRSRFHAVLAELEECSQETNLGPLKSRRQQISADAPPGYRVVQAIAYNTAVNASYPEHEAQMHRYKIGFWRRVFANWLPMRSFGFKMERRETQRSPAMLISPPPSVGAMGPT